MSDCTVNHFTGSSPYRSLTFLVTGLELCFARRDFFSEISFTSGNAINRFLAPQPSGENWRKKIGWLVGWASCLAPYEGFLVFGGETVLQQQTSR